jgi:hypothetical protein
MARFVGDILLSTIAAVISPETHRKKPEKSGKSSTKICRTNNTK